MYYLFDTGGVGDIGFIDDPPETKDGISLMDCNDCEKGYFLKLHRERPTPDLLRTIGAFYLFSEQAWNTIAQFDIAPGIHVTPVTVDTLVDSRPYFAISSKRQKVLDLEMAEYRWRVPDIVLAEVTKWVLDPKKMQQYTLVKADDGTWIVADAFRDMWLENGFIGAEFTPIEGS